MNKLAKVLRTLVVLAVAGIGSTAAFAQRYCNPLPMPIGPGGNASGDVSVMEEGGKYYMCCSGGGMWVSDDLLNWEHRRVDLNFPVAPDIVKYNGKFYVTGNSDHVFCASDPLGPYTDLGVFKNTGPIENGWLGGFDCKIFVDDDNQPYLFWPGRGISGIYGVKLDKNDLTKFDGVPTHLFGFNPMHVWERYGEANEYPMVAWIEGPWVIKRNGIYYLEYSASGTQWKTYAEGYYTATSPLGPYTYAANNPLLRKTEGLVTGTAHGSIVKMAGKDEWWHFYTIVLGSPGGRRIGMDKVTFDSAGLMYCTVTDTPQPAPGTVAKEGAPESIPVSIRKVPGSDSHSKWSSQKDGYPVSFAVDNFSETAWMPLDDDKQPYIMVDLGPATRFDVVQLYNVDAVRILFTGARRGFGFGAPGGAAPALPVYKYKVDVSMDGENFTTVLDKTQNTVSKDTIFEEFKPTECRYARLTVTEWPEGPLGIIDLTFFGVPSRYLLPQVASPVFTDLPHDGPQFQRAR